jgi:hypothetical protein
MRPGYDVYYDTAGRAHLVTTSPDADFVVSAYIEHGTCARWHFGYNRREQDALAELVLTDSSLRRAILVAWYDAVDPDVEGRHPTYDLDLTIIDSIGWAKFATGERDGGYPVILLTRDDSGGAQGPVRLGREIYGNRPYIPATRIRAAGAEYIRTGRLPESLTWQRRACLVAQGSFGQQSVAGTDLPPELEWRYPEQAQPWAHDPPTLAV